MVEGARPAVLITGSHEFFVEEAAEQAREHYLREGYEIELVPDEEVGVRLESTLLTGSLFATPRLIEADLTPLFGREDLGALLADALSAWEKDTTSGRREAFKKIRTILSAMRLRPAPPEELAAVVAKKHNPAAVEALAEILREMPEWKGGASGASEAVVRFLENPTPETILLATAVNPPKGAPLRKAFEKFGEIRDVSADSKGQQILLRARARRLAARERVTIEEDAIARLLSSTDADPRLFASELEKILAWAEEGQAISPADVAGMVDDRESEDVYEFFNAFGGRKREETFLRLQRIFSGRPLRLGDKPLVSEEPLRAFFGMLVNDVRRMLLVRARCEETGTKLDSSMQYQAYVNAIHPRLSASSPPFSASPLTGNPFLWFKAYVRAANFTLEELEAACLECSAADEASKESIEIETLIVALVAGILRPKSFTSRRAPGTAA